MNKIPKKIHQIWYQGLEAIPEKYRLYSNTWRLESDFEYVFWDKSKIENLINCFPKFWSVYDSFPTMIEKIDYAKYVILYVLGGIYIDMDVFSVNSLKRFFDVYDDRDFIAFEHNTPFFAMVSNKVLGLRGQKMMNNAVIASKDKNQACLKLIQACAKKNQKWATNFISNEMRCLVTTGPIAFTNCINKLVEKKPDLDIEILEATMVEPFTTFEIADLLLEFSNKGLVAHTGTEIMNHFIDLGKKKGVLQISIGIHMSDLNWFVNGKNDWKFKLIHRFLEKSGTKNE